MDTLVETWITNFENADTITQITLQAFMYGILCWIQESQEESKQIPITYEELMEYSEEFGEFQVVGFETLYEHIDKLKNSEPISKEELETAADKLVKYADENITCNILTTLINGKLLTDVQWESIYHFITPNNTQENKEMPEKKEEPTQIQEQQPGQEQENNQEPNQEQLPVPIPTLIQQKKRFQHTRCVKGRRSITPIKRRNGHKAISRHKTRSVKKV
jgi:hypothetical protein